MATYGRERMPPPTSGCQTQKGEAKQGPRMWANKKSRYVKLTKNR